MPRLRSSRVAIVDTKPDPKRPVIVKTIEREELAAKTGYTRPHTVHADRAASMSPRVSTPKAKSPAACCCSINRVLSQRQLRP
ncbi:hypothetical protein BURKHO8Y_180150 [Burkholderia sp. 8Y]|uniref:selenium-binding protein SBP56-related protein n=1 Tax=Burkholderia sp. 8Y TaxID=2653133 RepID=UPI0012F008C0|nr:hypothetical protein BURKHO8Y_180150 [Burkholderia sp. 8Y]